MSEPNYALTAAAAGPLVPAPDVPYRPREPKSYRPGIAVIGCGGISATHLEAYAALNLPVVVLCDRTIAKAAARRDQFFPHADISDDVLSVYSRGDVEVVDLTPHPADRLPLIEMALTAGKHVLSQKPFVTDLDDGRRLCDIADNYGLVLAVNQNGRFAPHFAYLREAAKAGHVGRVASVRAAVAWDHNWVAGLPFDEMRHLLLFDFAVHWFDFVASVIPAPARRVFASIARSPGQKAKPPLLAHVVIDYDDAQATLTFDADSRFAAEDRTAVIGDAGTLRSVGPSLSDQTVTLTTAEGVAVPELVGSWFPGGFGGAMLELLAAAESGTRPLHDARDNLRSLALVFAAMRSADTGRAVTQPLDNPNSGEMGLG